MTTELLRLSAANILFSSVPLPSFSRRRKIPPIISAHKAWIAQLLAEEVAIGAAAPPPIDLRGSVSSFLEASDDPTLQTSAGILLTGAFTLFLFRSLRRRVKLAKQMKMRSTGASNSAAARIRKPSKTSADQALVGALIAAAFGLLLYKFTTAVETTLNHQILSNNYSVRQITITIRTIINGICYLATFVFGFNSIGLFLYSGQLALNSFVHVKGETSISSKMSDVDETISTNDDQSSDQTRK